MTVVSLEDFQKFVRPKKVKRPKLEKPLIEQVSVSIPKKLKDELGCPLLTVTLYPRPLQKLIKGQWKITMESPLPSNNEYNRLIRSKTGYRQSNGYAANAATNLADELKNLSRIAVLQSLQDLPEPPMLKSAICVVQAFWPDRRRRDCHNLIYKYTLDEFTRSGIWKDDNLVELRILLAQIDPAHPRLEFYIWPLDNS